MSANAASAGPAQIKILFGAVPWFALPHAAWLLGLLARTIHEQTVPRNMMKLMLVSLTFVLWFIVPPFAVLVARG